MMCKHTLITVVFAPYSSQMHYSAPSPVPSSQLELYLIGAQNLGPVLHSDSSFELNEKHSTLKSHIGLW